MKEFNARRHARRGFTLVEVLIVVLILGLLVLLSVGGGEQAGAIMSEGVAGVGRIRNQMRIYMTQQGSFTGAAYSASSNNIGIGSDDLCGKYFKSDDYTLTVISEKRYLITAGPPSLTSLGRLQYQIDQDGSETRGSGYYTSGQ